VYTRVSYCERLVLTFPSLTAERIRVSDRQDYNIQHLAQRSRTVYSTNVRRPAFKGRRVCGAVSRSSDGIYGEPRPGARLLTLQPLKL
jgi:hypothetical protein